MGDKRTIKPRNRFMVYMNTELISWSSTRQSTVETSVFCAKFVAMKQDKDVMKNMAYKMRIMRGPISGPTSTFCDDVSVIHNTMKSELPLKKKCISIC